MNEFKIRINAKEYRVKFYKKTLEYLGINVNKQGFMLFINKEKERVFLRIENNQEDNYTLNSLGKCISKELTKSVIDTLKVVPDSKGDFILSVSRFNDGFLLKKHNRYANNS